MYSLASTWDPERSLCRWWIVFSFCGDHLCASLPVEKAGLWSNPGLIIPWTSLLVSWAPSSRFCLFWIQPLFFFLRDWVGSIRLHGPSALGLRPEKKEGRRSGRKIGRGEDTGDRGGRDRVRQWWTDWDGEGKLVEGGSKLCCCGYSCRHSGT